MANPPFTNSYFISKIYVGSLDSTVSDAEMNFHAL